MFLLFGTKAVQTLMNVVVFACHYCGTAADQRVFKRSTRLTLFFMPLFPLASSFFNECSRCGGTTELSAAQANHSLDWARARPTT